MITPIRPGRYEVGEEWVACRECGALVVDRRAHDAHHDLIDTLATTVAALGAELA